MTVFSGMEAIDIKDIDQEVITSMLFDLLDNENSLAEDLSQIDQMLVAEDKFNIAFEQLEALRDSIEEFGLSKGIIKAVDPDGYLEANGIVPAYEELNNLPAKSNQNINTVKKVDGKIKIFWEKIKEFMINLWNKMKKFLIKLIGMFKNYEKVLKKIKEKLSAKKEFDDKKINNKEFKLINKTELFGALNFFESNAEKMKNLNNLFNKIFKKIETDKKIDLNEINKIYEGNLIDKILSNENLVVKYIGIKLNNSNNELTIKDKSDETIYLSTNKNILPSFGYSSTSDIIEIVEVGLKNTKAIDIYKSEIKELNVLYDRFNNIIKNLLNNIDNVEDFQNQSKKALIIKKFIIFDMNLIRKIISANIKAIKAVIIVGNAGLSISK